MTEEDRLFPLDALSPQNSMYLVFFAMRISDDTSDWSTFKVCIQNSCIVWEDWPSLILPIHIWQQSSHKFSSGVNYGVL